MSLLKRALSSPDRYGSICMKRRFLFSSRNIHTKVEVHRYSTLDGRWLHLRVCTICGQVREVLTYEFFLFSTRDDVDSTTPVKTQHPGFYTQ